MPSSYDETAHGDTAARPEAEHVILIAEDDGELRGSYELWLRPDDRWEVKVATDGHEALERLDDGVDVLVLDRRMPGLSGPEIVDRLDASDFEGDVVVVSAFEQDRRLDADDVEDYLSKPVKKATFLETLEEVVTAD